LIRIGFAAGFAKRESRGRKDSRSKQIPRIRESRFAGFANPANPRIRGIRKIWDFANPANPRTRRIRESHANASPWIRAFASPWIRNAIWILKKDSPRESGFANSRIQRKDSPIWIRLDSHEIRNANHRIRASMVILAQNISFVIYDQKI